VSRRPISAGTVSGWPGQVETMLIGENHGLHPIAQAELGEETTSKRYR
jgi:hypothetical protein